jgi:pimeloyl-ACP methyl ester carboxylesterase
MHLSVAGNFRNSCLNRFATGSLSSRPVSDETVQAQLAAIQGWGQGDTAKLGTVQHCSSMAVDVMMPSCNSFELDRRLPNAQLSIFPDAGHGGILQHHAAFVQQAVAFLRQ